MAAFTADPANERVLMVTEAGPAWLGLGQMDRLLDVFMEAGAIVPFNAAYDAFLAAGGIARVSCFRARAVTNLNTSMKGA